MEVNYRNKTKLRVRYGETDQMGYCYYGNFAQYFEVGRVEALRNIGMSYRELEEAGVMLPVTEFNVKYRNPARYDDELTIETILREIKGAKIVFDYIIYNEGKVIITEASTTLVFVSRENMRPRQPPTEFMELINKILL